MAGNINNVPNFLKAKTPEELRVLMYENNIKAHTEFKYYDISFSKGFWYAWYIQDITKSLLKQVSNG